MPAALLLIACAPLLIPSSEASAAERAPTGGKGRFLQRREGHSRGPASLVPRSPADDPLRGLERFTRAVLDGDDPRGLVALRSYIPSEASDSRPRIDLVGVIHLAEARYFRELQARLAGYDLVLYEELGYARFIPVDLTGCRPREPVFQGAALKPGARWHRADWTLEEQARALGRRMPKARGRSRHPELSLSEVQREMMIRGLGDPESAGIGVRTRVEVVQRNSIAFGELVRRLHRGHKRVAVLYGAAHMPDLERRIRDELGYKEAGVTWLRALHVRARGRRARLY